MELFYVFNIFSMDPPYAENVIILMSKGRREGEDSGLRNDPFCHCVFYNPNKIYCKNTFLTYILHFIYIHVWLQLLIKKKKKCGGKTSCL